MITDLLLSHIQSTTGETVVSVQTVSGGSINQAAKITLSGGDSFFLKWNTSAPADMFAKELRGLELLRDAGTGLKVPEAAFRGTAEDGTGWLLIEFVEEASAKNGSNVDFGHQLAALHRQSAAMFGLDHDNYIGRLPQSNNRHSDWISFFIEERIEPQLKLALQAGKLKSTITNSFEALYRALPDIMPDEPPALLHGDLWGGNYFFDRQGRAVIYDPAVYYGHREIELAFTHLFGGFSSSFYQAYQEAFALAPDFNSRIEVYNLYPLLVHTNLFGGSYARQVEEIVAPFGR